MLFFVEMADADPQVFIISGLVYDPTEEDRYKQQYALVQPFVLDTFRKHKTAAAIRDMVCHQPTNPFRDTDGTRWNVVITDTNTSIYLIPQLPYRLIVRDVLARHEVTDNFFFPSTSFHKNVDVQGQVTFTFGNIFGDNAIGFTPDQAQTFQHLAGKRLKNVHLAKEEGVWVLKKWEERE
jgi:hypothetical protein